MMSNRDATVYIIMRNKMQATETIMPEAVDG